MNKGSRKEMNVIGIDVSRLKLDCAWFNGTGKLKTKVFANSPAGWLELIEWPIKHSGLPLPQHHFVMDDCMDAGGRAMQEQLPERPASTMSNSLFTFMIRAQSSR
jgi:hypothetical protein